MAGAHRTRSARRGRRGRGRHCNPPNRQPYAWLGAGAITMGVGAALMGGAGAAHADTADSDSGSQSSKNSEDSNSSASEGAARPTERNSSSEHDTDATDNETQPSTTDTDADRDTPDDEADDDADADPEPSFGGDDTDDPGLDERDNDSEPDIEDEAETDAAASESENSPAPAADLESAAELTDVDLTSSPDPDTDTPGQAAALLTLTGNARRETTTQPTMADTSSDEAAKEASDAQFNLSIGWIPGVGTVYNGISLISDLAEFSAAIGRGDTEDMMDEIGDMTVDAVGMIPVIGAPLAATLHQIRSAAAEPPNATPVAGGDSFSTEEDTPVTGNLLLNDSDAEGAPLTAGTKTDPSHGAVLLNPDGSFTYTPAANFHGTDTFTYTVSDGVKRATGTVTITVSPVADAPVAGADTVSLDEDTPTQITVLTNDSDGDDDPLTIVDVTAADFGDVTLGDDGTVTYTPDANYHGTDTFTYTITDGSGETSTATVSLIINPINDAPVVTAPDLTVDEDVVVTGNLLEHATDADGDPLTVIIGTTATHGTVALNADGSFTYTPDAEYSGADTFTYTVTDAAGASITATVSLTIKAINDAPVAGADTGTVDEDNAVVVPVLDNDSDIEGGSLSVVGVGTPGHGTAGIGDNGTVTYTPAVNFFGTDTFTYTVSDGQGGTTVATVTITVNPINDAPVAAGDNFGVNQNTSLTGNVLGNDSDPDGDPLTVSLGAGPASGGVVLNPDGSFTYNPNGGFHGTDSFTYTVTDSTGATSTATASITVNYVAPQPTGPTLSQRVETFVNNTRGRTIANPDGSFAGECVSLVRQYLEQALNIRTGAWGNAIDYRNGGSGGNQLAARGFTWHTDRNFQNGDVLVFGQNSAAGTSAYGHIGIWANGQFFDQNNGWRANARTANYSPLSGVSPALLGYWRPPGGSTGGGTGGATSGTKRGTATVIQLVNVRNDPSTNGPIVAQYGPGDRFNYDSWVIANGYQWVSYISNSGVRRYVAEARTDGSVVYLNGAVFH